ncbi:MAG: hypothetical protein C0624_05095 [Desulfuromonas sp.]|nr:MAG: hypothetical protein C0624_05095 [Desulfuromonas sp.]
MKKQSLILVALLAVTLAPLAVWADCHPGHVVEGAEHDHGKVAMSHEDHAMDHGDMKKDHDMGHDSMKMKGGMIMLGMQEVDGVKANIHMKDVAAKMAEMGMDVTHHFMIALTDAKSGENLGEGVVAVKITDPSGKVGKATKLMGMQGHFGVDVTLKDAGEYHFDIATKLADGKTRKFAAEYAVK